MQPNMYSVTIYILQLAAEHPHSSVLISTGLHPSNSMTLEEISFTYSSSSSGIRVIDSPNNYALSMWNLLHHH
jgi:hypothetical protein